MVESPFLQHIDSPSAAVEHNAHRLPLDGRKGFETFREEDCTQVRNGKHAVVLPLKHALFEKVVQLRFEAFRRSGSRQPEIRVYVQKLEDFLTRQIFNSKLIFEHLFLYLLP